MRRDQQLDRLRMVPLFGSLSKRELQEIQGVAHEIEFREGSEVVQEGLIGDEFYLILEGTARVTKEGRELRMLGRGDYFGELAIILGTRRTASVSAVSRLWVLRLDSTTFFKILDTIPSIARKILIQVAGMLIESQRSSIE